MSWKRITSVAELGDGQRFRVFYGGDSFETARSRIGGDDSKRVYTASGHRDRFETRGPEQLEHWLGVGYTVEALVDDRPEHPADVWNRVSLALCEAALKTPTESLTKEQWQTVEFCMRKIAGLAAALRRGLKQVSQ